MARWGPAVLAAGLGLACWVALASRLPEALLPGPLAVGAAALARGPELAGAALMTGGCALLGLVISLLLGVIVAVGFLRWRALELALYPWALLIQTLPVVAVAPLLLVWLGYGRPVAVATTVLVCFFPLLTSLHVGLRAATAAQVELFTLLGAGFWTTLLRLRAPAALPQLFAGLRTAAGLCVVGAVVGEFVGSNGLPPSLGSLAQRAARSADTATSFAAIGAASGLAVLFFGVVRWLEDRVIGAWSGR